MNPKKFSRIVNNPRHISGVHNYCDRWCERCPLTLRCSVFAVEQAEEKKPRQHDPAGEKIWERLVQLMPTAAALLEKHSDHRGISASKSPKFKNHDSPMDRHRLGAAAKRYMEFVHLLLRENKPALPPASAESPVAVTAEEAFEIISFYHMFLAVKLSRALGSREMEAEEIADDPEMADMPSDADGSAKIVLIAIDRSILAWTALSQHLPALDAATSLPALLTLHRLRTGIEKVFPKARAFIRPGFDTLKFTRKRIV